MLETTELFWIILGVTVCVIIFICCCLGCMVVCYAIFGDDENKDKTEETTEKSSKTVELSSAEAGWSVSSQRGGMYPPPNSGPLYPPASSTPYPPMSLPSLPPYPALNPPQAPYPAANSRTPSPLPYLPYPVQNVNEKRNGTDDIKPSAPGSD